MLLFRRLDIKRLILTAVTICLYSICKPKVQFGVLLTLVDGFDALKQSTDICAHRISY